MILLVGLGDASSFMHSMSNSIKQCLMISDHHPADWHEHLCLQSDSRAVSDKSESAYCLCCDNVPRRSFLAALRCVSVFHYCVNSSSSKTMSRKRALELTTLPDAKRHKANDIAFANDPINVPINNNVHKTTNQNTLFSFFSTKRSANTPITATAIDAEWCRGTFVAATKKKRDNTSFDNKIHKWLKLKSGK